MGYMRHHAIIVTSCDEASIKAAHNLARRWQANPSSITKETTNGYRSFLIPPDGSKEGWDESQMGNNRRDALVRHFRSDDKFRMLEWVEVQFADESGNNLVTRDSSRVSEVADRLNGVPAKGER